MQAISSNHFSVDQQLVDALSYLQHNHADEYTKLVDQFPEIANTKFDEPLSHFDTDSMGVNIEWSSWVIDAVEATGLVVWEEGEPWANG